jgi:hypothetical protein
VENCSEKKDISERSTKVGLFCGSNCNDFKKICDKGLERNSKSSTEGAREERGVGSGGEPSSWFIEAGAGGGGCGGNEGSGSEADEEGR